MASFLKQLKGYGEAIINPTEKKRKAPATAVEQ
jgi:hypothetical protein